jgi:hypothetical protein
MMSALRELVEAEDAGEDAREFELGELLSLLRDSLAKIAEMNECGFEMQPAQQIRICASQERLSRLLLFLGEQVIARQGCFRVEAERADRRVEIRIETDGKRLKRESEGRSWRDRVIEMRMRAAANYIATIGGALQESETGYEIALPAATN